MRIDKSCSRDKAGDVCTIIMEKVLRYLSPASLDVLLVEGKHWIARYEDSAECFARGDDFGCRRSSLLLQLTTMGGRKVSSKAIFRVRDTHFKASHEPTSPHAYRVGLRGAGSFVFNELTRSASTHDRGLIILKREISCRQARCL